jgi:Neuraminidase (sialidase)
MKKIILPVLLCSIAAFSSCAQPEDHTKVKADNALFFTGQKEGVSCFRIPAIVTAPNGDLVAAIDERVPSCGDLKFSKDINIAIRISKDNGLTWDQQQLQ